MGAVLDKIPNKVHEDFRDLEKLDLDAAREIEKSMKYSIKEWGGMASHSAWTKIIGSNSGFSRMDVDDNGQIATSDIMVAVFLTSAISLRDKAIEIFDMFDIHEKKELSEEKLNEMISLSIDISQRLTDCYLNLTPQFMSVVARMVFRATSGKNGKVSLDSFLTFCENSESAYKLLGRFNTTDKSKYKNHHEKIKDKLPDGVREILDPETSFRTKMVPKLINEMNLNRPNETKESVAFGDGKRLTLGQVLRLKDVFDVLDGDYSGEISLQELEQSFSGNKAMSSSTSPIFNNVDKDGSGKITFFELLTCLFPKESKRRLVYMTQLVVQRKISEENLRSLRKIFNRLSQRTKFDVWMAFGDQRRLMTVDEDDKISEVKDRFELLMDFIPDNPAVIRKGGKLLDANFTLKTCNVGPAPEIFDANAALSHADSIDSNKLVLDQDKLSNDPRPVLEYVVPDPQQVAEEKRKRQASQKKIKRELLEQSSALLVYVKNGLKDNLRNLLKNDKSRAVKLMAVDKTGKTALHYAVELGSKEIVELLLSYGAELNLANKRGNTPLHIACQCNNAEMIEILIAKGASSLLMNTNDRKPHQLISDSKVLKIVKEKNLFQDLEKNNPFSVGLRFQPLFVNKRMARYRVKVKDMLSAMYEDDSLRRIIKHYTIVRIQSNKIQAEAKLNFHEFLSQVFKETHFYHEMLDVLLSDVKNLYLSKSKFMEFYPILHDADFAQNYRDVREFLKTAKNKSIHDDQVASIIEWYDKVRYEYDDASDLRDAYLDFWKLWPIKHMKHAGYKKARMKVEEDALG